MIIEEFSGETEFTLVEIELEDNGPEELPTIGISLSPSHGGTDTSERCLQISTDEARVMIAGLAAVIR